MRWTAACLLAALGGCTLITDSFLTNDFSGDPFPIGVDRASGAVLVGVRPSGDTRDHRAVLDLLSPFTLIDPGSDAEPSLSYVDLTLLGKRPDGTLTLPRARFPQAQLISLHPCAIPAGTDPTSLPACTVGPTGQQPFDAVVGADALAGDAVRLRLDQDQIFVLADVGGSDRGRTLDCDAVFGSPYRGGGTLVLAGTELPFGNRRITLQACLGPELDPHPDTGQPFAPATFRQHGADALLVVSTSLGISILGRSAYDRYRTAVASDPPMPMMPPPAPFDQLAPGSVFLPSGLVTGRLATVDRLSLVAASAGNALSPCRQLYAHRLLTTYQLTTEACRTDSNGHSLRDCPCKTSGDLFCSVPAILELPDGIDVLVVDDTDPTLQALRTELRPDQPEVDGILGTDVLRGAEIDVDYPHDRLLARCPGGHCIARPALAQQQDICQINRCITGVLHASGCDQLLPEIPLPPIP